MDPAQGMHTCSDKQMTRMHLRRESFSLTDIQETKLVLASPLGVKGYLGILWYPNNGESNGKENGK